MLPESEHNIYFWKEFKIKKILGKLYLKERGISIKKD